jgi:hypothetical protein
VQKRYLSPEEGTAIIAMRAEGKGLKDIAKKFGICQATVSNIINGRHRVRGKSNRRRACAPPRPHCEPEPDVQDFSQLPDDVLFKHVKPWDYIG